MRSIHRYISSIRTKDQKRKAPDIKSNSIINQVCQTTITLNIMSMIKNKVQLMGDLGNTPEIKNLANA